MKNNEYFFNNGSMVSGPRVAMAWGVFRLVGGSPDVMVVVSLRVHHQRVIYIDRSSLESYNILFSTYAGFKIAIPEISLNTQGFPSVRLPALGITYPQRRFRQSTSANMLNK
jgi:hypothetical protein